MRSVDSSVTQKSGISCACQKHTQGHHQNLEFCHQNTGLDKGSQPMCAKNTQQCQYEKNTSAAHISNAAMNKASSMKSRQVNCLTNEAIAEAEGLRICPTPSGNN